MPHTSAGTIPFCRGLERSSRVGRLRESFARPCFHGTMRPTHMSSEKESKTPAVPRKVRECFSLRENPFRDNAGAEYYFPLPSHERAIDHCIRSVVNQTGMPLIHGPEGTGKTMLATKLRARFAEGSSGLSFQTHVIDGAIHSRSSTPALRELSLALGGRKTTPNYRLYDEIETSATAKLTSGTCVVALLERAELFQDDMMRMVLFLWNLVTRDGSQFLVRLIAFGRPAYLRTLEKTKYANIRSRTVFGAPGLKAFTPEELISMIRHRVGVAGGSTELFDDDALLEIHRISAGNPRIALATAGRALVATHKAGASLGWTRSRSSCRVTRRLSRRILRTMDRLFFALGSLSALIGVAAGAFGAHGLKGRLEPDLLITFEVGVRYQMYHAFGLLACAWAYSRWPSPSVTWAGWLFVVGTVIFSGSLYALSLSGMKWLGAVTPFGGVALIAGWAALAWAAWSAR